MSLGIEASILALSAPPKIYSITQYNKSMERLIKTAPQVWVKGVITQLNVRGRVAYLSLAEFEENNSKPLAILDLTLWTSQLEAFNIRFAELPLPFKLRIELKIAALIEPSFYVPLGRFQPRIKDIDGSFTLGELSQTRQKILEKLLREGLLEKNKKLAFSEIPLRVGLITAPSSAAYHDFTSVLLGSGFSFQIAFVGAKMQGENTEETVLLALQHLGKMPLDVICLVRGGGAKMDLVYFDSEKICRAIANSPVPVLTGIGHEIDNSLADLAAYENKITPTDCAKFLEERLAQAFSRLVEGARLVQEIWNVEWMQARNELASQALTVKLQWEKQKSGETWRSKEWSRAIKSLVKQLLRREADRLQRNLVGLQRGPLKIWSLEKLKTFNQTKTIKSLWMQKLDAAHEGLVLKEKLMKMADPAQALRLGYSILRDTSGKILTNASQVNLGQKVINQMQDGNIESQVLTKKEIVNERE